MSAVIAQRVPDNICIVMMSAVGDAVHVLPVINALKRTNPATRITWVLQPGPATLVRGHRSLDEIVIFDRARGLAAFADFNLLFTNRKIPASPVQHVQDQYLEFLAPLGVSSEPLEWDLGPWPGEREWQRTFKSSLQRPIASIVVATSKPEKDWIPERWADVADALYEDYGMEVVLVGGTSERERSAERIVMGKAKHKPRSELGSGLRNLVSILDASALVLSPDTGPLHMAVALNRPVISLMGYTNPKRTGPYRRFHDLIVDAYGDPGEDYPISMENRPGRMKRIETRHVLDKVTLWRDRYA